MNTPARDITLYVFYDGKWHTLQTFQNEYRNLMMLIYDKIDLDDFGECLGMGKCGTCLIEIMSEEVHVSNYDRNEDSTIKKLEVKNNRIRLSCQILIDDSINGLKIYIL